jgi:hypothetical protein
LLFEAKNEQARISSYSSYSMYFWALIRRKAPVFRKYVEQSKLSVLFDKLTIKRLTDAAIAT